MRSGDARESRDERTHQTATRPCHRHFLVLPAVAKSANECSSVVGEWWRGVAATTMRVSPREQLLCRSLLVKGCIWTRVSRASTLLLREALGSLSG
ncbi:unnamed protein product [Sphagnum jensenii]